MKHLLFFWILLTGSSLLAQEMKPIVPIDSETNKIKFQEVVKEPGTKDELFNRCVYWLNDTYKDPVRITSIRDIETGKIEGTHRFKIYYLDTDSIKKSYTVDYTFIVEMKDGKYRYTIDELVIKAHSDLPIEKWTDKSDPEYSSQWDDLLQQISDFVKEWSDGLKEHMAPEKTEKEEDDDW